MKTIYHFSGAGNDFVVIDGREGDVSAYREVPRIQALCREFKTDGLMILGQEMPGQAGHDESIQAGHDGNKQAGQNVMAGPDRPSVDFVMEFYNPDGSGGMMCGNGGRCIVAFADYLGIRPGKGFLHPSGVRNDKSQAGVRNDKCYSGAQDDMGDGVFLFRAPDGLHTGEILARPEEGLWEVRIKMIDVHGITPMMGGFFLNTGTRHFVKFVPDVEQVDIDAEGKALRWDPAFAPIGTNVNFVHFAPDGLHVRTFEKGVEGETLACGTGLTASAIAAYEISRLRPAGSARNDSPSVIPSEAKESTQALSTKAGDGSMPYVISTKAVDDSVPFVISTKAEGRVEKSYRLRARQDWLSVDFTPGADATFTEVYLTGPAKLLAVVKPSE